MYEVEVKAHLRDKKAVIKKLKDLGCKFGKELYQIDHIFLPEDSIFPPLFSTPVLRIREQNGIFLFTLKISQSSRQDCIEKELEIKDGAKMMEIMKLLKYKKFVLVEKKRIKTKYRDMEIVLDNVKDLGEFVEAEKISTDENPENRKKIQDELFKFLETIGISKEDHVVGGKYDIMLHEIQRKLGVK
ncbi:MAG: class IV adenylate cyclase [Candidatus Paceibacterota bacterium]|jgi:predicted adenylyl cyclase CyaB